MPPGHCRANGCIDALRLIGRAGFLRVTIVWNKNPPGTPILGTTAVTDVARPRSDHAVVRLDSVQCLRRGVEIYTIEVPMAQAVVNVGIHRDRDGCDINSAA